MADMLRQIDQKVQEARLAQLETVAVAMSKGVPLVCSPHIKDGQYAIVVSPNDFKALQGYKEHG